MTKHRRRKPKVQQGDVWVLSLNRKLTDPRTDAGFVFDLTRLRDEATRRMVLTGEVGWWLEHVMQQAHKIIGAVGRVTIIPDTDMARLFSTMKTKAL
jgi:hypothetical protein